MGEFRLFDVKFLISAVFISLFYVIRPFFDSLPFSIDDKAQMWQRNRETKRRNNSTNKRCIHSKRNQIPKIAIFQAHAQLPWWALIKFLRTSATRLNIQTKATKATTTTQTIFLMKWSLAKANSSVFHKYWSKKKNIFMWSKIYMNSCWGFPRKIMFIQHFSIPLMISMW